MDDGICTAGSSVYQHVCRARNDVGVLDRDFPDRCGTPDGTADEVYGTGPHCFWFRLSLVRFTAMADRCHVAISDPGRFTQEVRLSGTNRGRETKDSWAQLREALRR